MQRRVLAIFAIVLITSVVSRAQDVDESQDTMTSVHAREMISAGDANVIPTLRGWLPHGLADDPRGSYMLRVNAAIAGIGAFDLADEGPMLVLLYRSPHADAQRRLVIAMAVSQMNSPGAATFLRQMVADQQLHHSGRCLAAIALVRSQDDEDARNFIVQEFKKQLVSLSTGEGWDGLFVGELGKLYDPPLMERLKALEPEQSDPQAKGCIGSTLQSMALRHLTTDQLFAIAENADPIKAAPNRDEVIRQLGEVATPDMIDRINALKVRRPVNKSGVPIAERLLVRLKEQVIGRIRQRAYAASPHSTTQP